MEKTRSIIIILVVAAVIATLSGCDTDISNSDSSLVSDIDTPLADYKAEYDEDLCADGEYVLLSFKSEDFLKSVSVCVSETNDDYIVYRFGNKDKIELEFPEDRTDSWNKFNYSYYLRGGGADNEGLDLNYLSFENSGNTYEIYQEYYASSNTTNIGIKITDISTNEEIEVRGLSDSIKGSLIYLRENDKVTRTEI